MCSIPFPFIEQIVVIDVSPAHPLFLIILQHFCEKFLGLFGRLDMSWKVKFSGFDRVYNFGVIPASKRELAEDHLIENNPQTVHISSNSMFFSFKNFWSAGKRGSYLSSRC